MKVFYILLLITSYSYSQNIYWEIIEEYHKKIREEVSHQTVDDTYSLFSKPSIFKKEVNFNEIKILPKKIPTILENQSIPRAITYYGSWKRNITATVFWVGEGSSEYSASHNRSSAWDVKWLETYGGVDTPKDREGYLPKGFKPNHTPFYIALPFNDLRKGKMKTESLDIIPWFEDKFITNTKSVCENVWVMLHKNGEFCYAQWKDVGPFRTDDALYVFGDSRPQKNPNRNVGIDISPAVRDFLKVDGYSILDWKFIPEEEVPEGPWKTW